MIKDSRYYYGLGMECYEMNDYKKAVEFFQQSVVLQDHFKTFELLYRCYLKIGEYTSARECIEKAYFLNNKNDRVAVLYATVLLSENSIKSTETIIQDVLDRNPTYGPAKRLYDEI